MEIASFPVDVISICSANGEIRPLRMRMEMEDHRLLRLDVDEIVSIKEIQYKGIEAQIFLCRASAEGKQYLVELKYMIRIHSWSVTRKVC